MSSRSGFSQSLIVPVRASLLRLALSVIVHGIGLLALLAITPLTVMMTGFLVFALMLSLIHDLSQYGPCPPNFRQLFRGMIPHRLVQLQFTNGQWRAVFDDGVAMDVELTGFLYTGRWFMVLRFRSETYRTIVPLVIGRDTVPPDVYRRMGVVLRLA